jgi:hypothetical protein
MIFGHLWRIRAAKRRAEAISRLALASQFFTSSSFASIDESALLVYLCFQGSIHRTIAFEFGAGFHQHIDWRDYTFQAALGAESTIEGR